MYLKKLKTMNKGQKYIYYLAELISIIQEKRLELIAANSTDVYEIGQLSGYTSLLDYIKQLATENGLAIKVLGFDVTIQNHINTDELQNENYTNYKKILPKIVGYIIETLISTRQKKDLKSQGELFAYYDIITIMKEQAELSFKISATELGMKGKNLEELAFAQI